MDNLDTEMIRKGGHDLLSFVQTQHAVVDEHAGKLVADGFMTKSRRHGSVDAPRQTKNDLIPAHLATDAGPGFLYNVAQNPISLAAETFDTEPRQHALPVSHIW